MSRILFYHAAASILAVTVSQTCVSVASAGPTLATRYAEWQGSPRTAAVVRALGPLQAQAAILCLSIDAGSYLVSGFFQREALH